MRFVLMFALCLSLSGCDTTIDPDIYSTTLPFHDGDRCRAFGYYEYQEIAQLVLQPDETPTEKNLIEEASQVRVSLNCPGQEISRAGYYRTVVYTSPAGGEIIIHWASHRILSISQSGLTP